MLQTQTQPQILVSSLQNSSGSGSGSDTTQEVGQVKKVFGKILLVEDDPVTGEWISRKVQKFGVSCDVVLSRAEALDRLSNRTYHAVVTDIYLEEGQPHGLALIADLTARGLPVVVITSRADLTVAKEALNLGASYLLEKPFTADELIGALEKIWDELRGHQGMLERFLDMNSLTTKEKEIVRLLLKGLSNKEVAQISGNTEKTIKFHLTTIFQKCGVSSRTELFNAVFPT